MRLVQLLAAAFLVQLSSCSKPVDNPSPNLSLSPNEQLMLAIEDNDQDATRAALKAGAEPNTPVGNSMPPLHMAAASGFVEIGRLLINHKANVNLLGNYNTPGTTKNGGMPLHVAINVAISLPTSMEYYTERTQSLVDFVQMLLENKADVNARDSRNKTPLDLTNVFISVREPGAVDKIATKDGLIDVLERYGGQAGAPKEDKDAIEITGGLLSEVDRLLKDSELHKKKLREKYPEMDPYGLQSPESNTDLKSPAPELPTPRPPETKLQLDRPQQEE